MAFEGDTVCARLIETMARQTVSDCRADEGILCYRDGRGLSHI